jgi:phage tail-like protein
MVHMTESRDRRSNYLQYLPPVLWEKDGTSSAIPLSNLLNIFEKILTGIDDGIPIEHDHQSLQEMIDHIPQLFNPWYTPSDFLPWLASWVALKLPTTGIWDEYQQRKAIAQIVQVYRQHGSKAGLNRYLDLYAIADKQPRVVIDDCNTLLFSRPGETLQAPIYASGLPGPSVRYDESQKLKLFEEGLVRPSCMTLATDGSLFIGDLGTPLQWEPTISPGVWRVLPPGHAQLSGASARPQRLQPSGWELNAPVAVAIDQETPANLYVLDNRLQNGATVLYKLIDPLASTTPEVVNVATKAALGLVHAIAMSLDPQNGHLLILDRGAAIPSPVQGKSAIIDVNIRANPITVERHTIQEVQEPLALLIMPNGDLVIGDAQEQNTTTPAKLLRVDRTDWHVTDLLANVPAQQNPLVAPRAVVQMGENLLVLDIGLRPYLPGFDPSRELYSRLIAESATVYLVNMAREIPVIVQACESRQLVFPTGMLLHQKILYICDQGEYAYSATSQRMRVWRVLPHEFGVVIHFSLQRPTTIRERRQISQNISDIVEQEKPAHTLATMAYQM